MRGVLTWLFALATLVVSDVVRADGAGDVRSPAAPAAPATPAAPPAPLGTTVTFPYEQQRLLMPYNGNGGLAYVPAGVSAGAKLPVIVFLHGMNAYGTMHMGFAAPFADLRTVVDELVGSGRIPPVVLAAPTHTRGAYAARRMWPDFDLAQFLTATELALGGAARLNRADVIVVAHSGGACNPAGGVFSPGVRAASPVAVLAIDTCLYEDLVPALASLAEDVHVTFYWQRAWPRPVDALADACPTCEVVEILDLPPKPSPHGAILPVAFERGLHDVLGAGPATTAARSSP